MMRRASLTLVLLVHVVTSLPAAHYPDYQPPTFPSKDPINPNPEETSQSDPNNSFMKLKDLLTSSYNPSTPIGSVGQPPVGTPASPSNGYNPNPYSPNQLPTMPLQNPQQPSQFPFPTPDAAENETAPGIPQTNYNPYPTPTYPPPYTNALPSTPYYGQPNNSTQPEYEANSTDTTFPPTPTNTMVPPMPPVDQFIPSTSESGIQEYPQTSSPGEPFDTTVPYMQTNKCLETVFLDDFCTDITTVAKAHFQYFLSLQNILDDVFRPEILSDLKLCPDGSWCLQDYIHQDLKSDGEEFYTVYCMNVSEWSMRGCLNKMKMQRPDCDDQVVDFMINSVSLLCNMWDKQYMDSECYTRTLEGLYPIFQVLQYNEPMVPDMGYCNPRLIETVKLYLCADDACHYDQQQLLKGFPAWVELAENLDYYMERCQVNRTTVCQGDHDENAGDYFYNYGDYYMDDNNYYNNDRSNNLFDKILNTVHSATGGDSGEPGTVVNKANKFTNGDKAIFVGLVVSVIVLSASFLLLVIFGLRRMQKFRVDGFPVYSKLATDEDLRRAELS